MARHVVLVGLMGSGKSSIGRPLAARLGIRYVDNDDDLRAATDASAREIARAQGIAELHRLEARMLLDALADPEPAVIGAAASAVLSAEVREALRGHDVVWLDTPVPVLAARVGRKDHRPYEDEVPALLLARQHAERAPLYAQVATVVVHPSRTPASDAAIAARLTDRFGH